MRILSFYCFLKLLFILCYNSIMIKIFNPNKLTRQPFFQELINYLYSHDDVTLRQIKRDFPHVTKIDRDIEDYVQAGYIVRQDKRYSLDLPLLEIAEPVNLDDMIFVDTESQAYEDLLALEFQTELANATNQARLIEKTDFSRNKLTLSNYFYKLKTAQPLSQEQEKLYEILGDVNPEYALKYMTTTLLKFCRKDSIKQKRKDIFVDSLLILGYLEEMDQQTYKLKLSLDPETFVFVAEL